MVGTTPRLKKRCIRPERWPRSGPETNPEVIVAHGGVEAVVEAMERHIDVAAVQRSGCKVFLLSALLRSLHLVF